MQSPSTGTQIEDRLPTPIPPAPAKQPGFLESTWARYKAKPAKQKIAIIAVPLGMLVFLSVGRRVMNPTVIDTPAYESEVQRRVDFETVDAPLNFLDITEGEYEGLSPQSQVDFLLNNLQEIEGRLLSRVNSNYVALLSVEANRMRTEAMKEANSPAALLHLTRQTA